MAFVNEVADAAEAAGHRPDIDIRWNKVTLALSSHDEGGLTERDVRLAACIQELDHPAQPLTDRRALGCRGWRGGTWSGSPAGSPAWVIADHGGRILPQSGTHHRWLHGWAVSPFDAPACSRGAVDRSADSGMVEGKQPWVTGLVRRGTRRFAGRRHP
jgi:hypothetical protein